jgi:predicted ribosomally synthesized peptide with SipW-like signal peptide
MKKIGLICLVVIVALGSIGAAYASWSQSLNIGGTVTIGTWSTETTVTLNPSQDSYINSGSANTNYGANVNLIDGRSGSTYQKALIKFTLSSIPSTAVITSATLQLYATADGNANDVVNMYRLRRAWIEGNNSTNSGVTWNTYNGSSPWGTAGAANISSDFINTIIATATIPSDGMNNWYSWTSPLLKDEVQAFVSGTTTNNGWILYPTSPGGGQTTSFSSKQGSFVPKLIVIYK